MKSEKNILIAFLLNLFFAVFEFVGGVFTGSVAVLSDALHDIGDALSIGLAFVFEKKSKRQPDEVYTYGYGRYSVLGGLITTIVLIIGSVLVITQAVGRLINPVEINYNGMIIFALVGVSVNFAVAYITRHGDSVNQKAVNLHMLEDVLGWITVLVGAIVMRFTDLYIIDPIMSVAVAVFILINALKNIKAAVDIFLEKTPDDISTAEIKNHLLAIDGVADVHHIHIRSFDGHNHYATMHIVTDQDPHSIKDAVRDELKDHGIVHATIETESSSETCHEKHCHTVQQTRCHHSHHHHH